MAQRGRSTSATRSSRPCASSARARTSCGRYQQRFRYILVDEFQDTNYAQFELVKLLAARHRNVTVVGDDDQAIYRFRGASMSNILGFDRTYPGRPPRRAASRTTARPRPCSTPPTG